MEVKEPNSQETRTKLSIETREHKQEHRSKRKGLVTITDVLVNAIYCHEFSKYCDLLYSAGF